MKKYCEKCIWFDYIFEYIPSCDRSILNDRFPQACSHFIQKTFIDEKIEVKDWLRYAYKLYRKIIGTVPDKNDVVRMLTKIRKQVRNGMTYKHLWGEIEGAAIIFGNSVIGNCYELAKDEVELVNWVLDHFHHDMITLTDKRDYIFKIYQEEMSIPLEELPDGYFFVEDPKQPDDKWQFYSVPCGVMYLWEHHDEDDYSGYKIEYQRMQQLYKKILRLFVDKERKENIWI